MKPRARAEFLVVSVTLLVASLMFAASGFVGVGSSGSQAYEVAYIILGIIFLILGLAGIGLSRRLKATTIPQKSIMGISFLALISFLGLLFLAFWMSDAFGSLDDILLEAVSGVTTTSFSLVNPEQLDRGVLFLRAFSQWAGGFGAFCFFSVILPIFVRSREKRNYGKQIGSTKARDSNFQNSIVQIFYIYVGVSGLLVIGYWAAGMGFFDAITHSFTTISTGGFSNYADGIAHFDSAAVEWVAIGGMFVAGISPALLFWVLRGSPGVLWRSLEMRIYASVIFIVSLFLVLGDGEGIRRSVFSVVSAISSTGFYLEDWGRFGFGLQMLLILVIATGTMSGTPGGGFGITRAIEAVGYIYRELLTQLHSKVIFKVKVGSQVVGEGSLSNMQSFQLFFVGAVALGTFALAQFGADLTSAISGSITALATMGPGIGDIFSASELGDVGGGIAGLSRPARATLSVLMLVGRISIFPLMFLLYRWWIRTLEGARAKIR